MYWTQFYYDFLGDYLLIYPQYPNTLHRIHAHAIHVLEGLPIIREEIFKSVGK